MIRYCYAFVFLLFFSCQEKQERHLLKKSSGKLNTISVIIDNQLWFGEVGDALRDKLAAPIPELAQEEPLFNINQYPAKLLEGFMTNGRIIIVVKKEGKSRFEINKNQYAKPQLVFHISGFTANEILKILDKEAPRIIALIKQMEISECQRLNQTALEKTKKAESKFSIKIDIPASYNCVLEKPNFIWLKKNIISGSASLLVYQLPLNKFRPNVSEIINIRDSIGKQYIKGIDQNSYLETDKRYTPFFYTKIINRYKVFETLGIWRLKNEHISGSFINYMIFDSRNKRTLVLEGFCNSSLNEKRDLMTELEAILKSFQL
jgi:Domain of unknown function (DUF4837)